MSHVPDVHDSCSFLHFAGSVLIGVLDRCNHDGSLHFDCARCSEDAATSAIEKFVIFHEGYGVDGGIESGGTLFEEGMGRVEVGLEGGVMFGVEIWRELSALDITSTSMEDERRLESCRNMGHFGCG
jgi:hypothetical protein